MEVGVGKNIAVGESSRPERNQTQSLSLSESLNKLYARWCKQHFNKSINLIATTTNTVQYYSVIKLLELF